MPDSPQQERSSPGSADIILTQTYVNAPYRYSFRYPSHTSVRYAAGDGQVATVLLEGTPFLTFSIITNYQ